MKKKFAVRFYLSKKGYSFQIEYKADSLEHCIIKAMNYARSSIITSFTIRRGDNLGNYKFADYIKTLYPKGYFNYGI